MEGALLWVILGGIVGWIIASYRGFSIPGGVLGGILLGPFLGLLMLLVGAEKRRCPHCDEWVRNAAKVCPHCQRDIPSALTPA